MPRLIWTPEALTDVQRLYRFLAPKNPDAARRAAATIRETAELLAAQPQIGRPAENVAPGFRELLIGFGETGYVALYHFDGETVALLAVRHQKEAGYSPRT